MRLLKVVFQAVFVDEDDEGNLLEVVGQPVTLKASDWPLTAVEMIDRTLATPLAEAMAAQP